MQNRKDAGQEIRIERQEGRKEDRKFAGKEGYRKGRIQERKNAGHNWGRPGAIEDRYDAGPERCLYLLLELLFFSFA